MEASWGKLEPGETREIIRIAGDQMGSFVRSTLGPFGQDKMIVRRMSDGDVRAMVTNDGIALIEEFEGETDHPIANRFIELAEAQEDDYGDGTTIVVLTASELLKAGLDLIEEGVHPIDVIEGFSIGGQRTLERWSELAIPLADEDGTLDREKLRIVAETGMVNGRASEWPLDGIADDVVDAVLRVSRPADRHVRLSYADTVVDPGGTVSDTTVIDGTIIPEEPDGAEHLLPLSGTVVIVEGDVQQRTPTPDGSVSVDTAEAARAVRGAGASQARAIADSVAEVGAVAVVAGGAVPDQVVREIGATGAVVFRNVKDSRIKYLSRATGATPVSGLPLPTEIAPEHVGRATVRYQSVKVGDRWIAFTADGAETPEAATILVRGGTERAAGEAERRIRHGKNALRASILRPEALPAGGAADIAAAMAVRDVQAGIEGREQLAVEAFADVLDAVPRQLAKNAGRDQIGALTTLRARHEAGHDRAGIGANGEFVDDITAGDGGLDPFLVRTSALVRAVEFVNDLLRIDGTLLTGAPSLDEPEETDSD